MGIVMKGKYETSPPSLANDQLYDVQLDVNGNLKTYAAPSTDDSWTLVLGTGSTTGKVAADAVANDGVIWAVFSCEDKPCNYIDWVVTCDVAWEYRLARAMSSPLGCTLTLADATVVDDGDTFLLNGLTFTAEATESDASAAARKFWTGASNAACAVNITALLNNATYGVPGITATVAAVSATDVITIAGNGGATGASTLDFGQGDSAADEIAFSDTTATNCVLQGALVASMAATTGYVGYWIEQAIGGWPFACLYLKNKSGSAAANFQVRAIRR